jgi:hypothetical protein
METPHKFAGLIPPLLLQVIKEKRCVLFAGAGLSAQAATEDGVHLPTWGVLLEWMIDWCIENRVDLPLSDKEELLDILKRKRFLVVAQELQQRLGSRLNACLIDVLHSGRIRPSEAHRLISKTDWVAALTSNYDGLIEGAYALESGGIVPPVLSQEGIGSALNFLRNERFFIFKLHGDLNIPGSIILGDRDYSQLLYLNSSYRSLLETIFATYTVLFVGFGGDDPDLNAITDRLSAIYERSIGQHFLLVPNDAYSSIERRRLLEDKRLDCITYEKDASHSQVVEFLKAIAYRSRADVPPPTPFESQERTPRVFISGSQKQISMIREIAEIVTRLGFESWYAESEIRAGDAIVDAISQAIVDSDCMVVILSEDSVRSKWVDFEAQRAYAAQKIILPIRMGEAPIPSFLLSIAYLQVSSDRLTEADKALIADGLQRILARKKEQKR